MSQLIDELIQVYREFSKASLSALPMIYADNATFVDPVHELKGVSEIYEYFESMISGLNACCFDFHDVDVLENKAFLTWTMTFQHKKLGKKQIEVKGMSIVHFDDKVISHHDYYDLGALLYEHVPVLGFGVRRLKSGLKASVA